MAEVTMTMHQLLAELKTVDARITKGLKVPLIAMYQGESDKQEADIKSAETNIISGYDSVKHLIENKKVLEAARAHSNDTTTVLIGGKEYTVSEAIKRKHDIKYDKELLNQMTRQYNEQKSLIENRNKLAQSNKQAYALKAFEAVKTEAEAADIKLKLERIAELEEKYVRENSFTMIDPLKLEEKIAALDKEITEFEINVDAALSVSNAITSVTVNLMD